jgi:DNA-binding SARP family transcriptional activator
VRIGDLAAIECDSRRLESRLAGAAGLVGSERVEALRAALAPSETGRFLDGIECAWVDERRQELEGRLIEARIDLAVAAFEEVEYETATEVLDAVVQLDPYRERAWRLLMRIGAAQGAEDWVIDAYRRCEAALGEVGLAPSEATRALAAGLRR